MSSTRPPQLNRRDLLRNGGIAISLAAVLAACGDRSGPTSPGKLGVELLPEAEPPDTTVDDGVLLRTLQSLEYTTIEMHNRLLASGDLPEADARLLERFIEDHQRHADQMGELVTQAGGTPFECANAFLMDRVVDVLTTALDTSDDPTRDAVEIANGFENWMGASYQAFVELLVDPTLRTAIMPIGGEECRHGSVLALASNPESVAPELAAPTEGGDDEFPTFYAIPAPFGQLTGITLQVGVPNEEGQRTSVQLQTPAENTFVYSDLSC